MAVVAGIDFSMTCPGITVGRNKKFNESHSFFLSSKSKLEGKYDSNIIGMKSPNSFSSDMERFDYISDWAIAIVKRFKVFDIMLEDYAMGAKGKVFHIAENTGILKYKLWDNGIQVHTVPPTTAKKYFSGKGNASKEDMYDAFYQNTNVNLEEIMNVQSKDSPISDVVDSYAMMCYGHDNIN